MIVTGRNSTESFGTTRSRRPRRAVGLHVVWFRPMSRLTSAAPVDVRLEPPPCIEVAVRVASAILAVLIVGAAGSRGLPLSSSPEVYAQTIGAVAGGPTWIGHGFEVMSELGLLILAGGVGLAALRHRHHAPVLGRVLAGGTGVVLAYLLSEALKVATAQPRPCRGLVSGAIVADCPSATDWSLPSNHAAIATAMAVALAFSVRHSARWAVPLALVVCASRVIIGVHYPHDVLSGMLLAAVVVTVSTLLLERPAQFVVTHTIARGPRRPPADSRTEEWS